ncbi:MAG: serine hydrolase [Clostridia bacterium]|nr:serine hydrolase [Clostridia bacterium]
MAEFVKNMVSEADKRELHVIYAQFRQGGEIKDEVCRAINKTRLNTFSVSKSIVSAGVGIALDEGLISLDEKICDAFEEYVPKNASNNLLDTRIRHMLTMTTGLKEPLFFADGADRYRVKDWIEYFFNAEFDHAPGERFLYSNFNTYMISCLIEKRAGVNLLEYLRYRLFEPLGIGNPDWTLCPKGHVHAANGLYLNIDELGNFGEMLLHRGEYNGKRLVPEKYIAEATVKHTDSPGKYGSDYLNCGYGYQFWMTPIPDTFLCYGNYGQFCFVMPKKDAVISILTFEGMDWPKLVNVLIDCAKEL